MESDVPALLIGYNVESSDAARTGAGEGFLSAAAGVHRELQAPCTLFVRGQTMERHPDAFRRFRDECGDLADLQQFTYSGVPLKTVCQVNHQGVKVFRGASLDRCREEVLRACEVTERILGTRPMGLAGPLGYYRGLSDRPDILEMLREAGIRFTRTYTRNARDWGPVSFETQPFWYGPQGFGEILEIPGQGWPDSLLKEAIGPSEIERYVTRVKKDLNYVAAKKLTWSCVLHDWACVLEDPQMTAARTILEYARELGFRFLTHRAYYEETSQARPSA